MSGAVDRLVLGDGLPLAYRLDGAADAPALVLSNSLGTRLEMWDPQLEALAARFRVVRYDGRGHGRSGAPPGAYGLDRLGRDVLELMDALGLERAAFCGLSMGGMVGQWLGVRAPERLTWLGLANTSAYMGPPSAWETRIGTVAAQGMAAVTPAVLERWFTPGFRARAPEAVDRLRAMLTATDPQGYAGCCAALRDMDQRATAALIRTPTLVVVGRADPATPPEHGRELAGAIPGARLVELEAAHLSNVEQPDAFTGALLEFARTAG